MMSSTLQGKIIPSIRWLVRIVGALLILLVLVFMIGEGIPDFFALSASEKVETIGMLAMLVGMALAWKYELPGALLTLLGYFSFVIVEGRLLLSFPFSLFLGVGLVFFLCWLVERVRMARTRL